MNHIIIRETCYNMRKGAREALRGRWTEAVKATLIFAAVAVLPTIIIDSIFDKDFARILVFLYSLAVSGPISLGYTSFMLKIIRNENVDPSEVLSGFERYGTAIVLYAVMSIFIFLWALLFIIPGIIAMYRYRLAFMVLCDNPHIGSFEAINESKRLMSGNKGKLFLLDLTFIGWMILAAMTFGIGYLALYPYMIAASVIFYEIANGNLQPKVSDITYGQYISEHPEPADNENSGRGDAEKSAED